jgi:undecaprenyl-diphosphatase
MVSLPEAILLGIVQGLTEWLPVSSSGHLVIFQEAFGINVPLFFDIILHLGTVMVILIYFRQDILRLLRTLIRLDFQSDDGRLILYIILGNIPIAFAGIVFYDAVTSAFGSPQTVAVALLATGLLLYISRFADSNRRLGPVDSVVVGLAQAVALIPGISRSGFTIGAGLLRGVAREEIFRYSFLLAAPAVLGAALLDLRNIVFLEVDAAAVVVGFVVAMAVGFFSLRLLSRLVLTGRFHLFAYYCWAVGLIVLVVTLLPPL